MSKVNIEKVIKKVGICSENLICISESLCDISKRFATIANGIAEIVSEFQAVPDESDNKKKMQDTKQSVVKEEDSVVPVKEYSFIEVRTFLADKSRAGHTAEVKKILAAHGADKLSELDKAEYAAVMAEAEVLE